MRSKINLTESLVIALESVKQALEIFYGFEIFFCGDLNFDPRKIKKTGTVGREDRYLTIHGSFKPRILHPKTSGMVAIKIYAEVEMRKDGFGWQADRARLGIGDLDGPHSWCVARWRFTQPEECNNLSTVHVIVEMGEGSDNTEWRVGCGLADRHLEPLFKKTIIR